MSKWVLCCFMLFLFFPRSALAEMKRLAVLEFSGIGVDPNLLSLFSDEARAGIVKTINKDEVLIMTRESTLQILKDMGKDASCMKGACEVEIARNIGADYVVSGAIIQSDGVYILTVKLHDTETSALLSSHVADSRDIHSLRRQTSSLSRQLILDGFGYSSTPSISITKKEKKPVVQKQTRRKLDGYKEVLIPKGTFMMGCTPEQGISCSKDEKPMHQVKLTRNFYMMETEVIQELYEAVMEDTPSYFSGERLPVEQVSWFDAVRFANELSRMEGLEICYNIDSDEESVAWENKDCKGWRLPTEAEWEYAARGVSSPLAQTSAKDLSNAARGGVNQKFSGSSSLKDVGWYSGNSGGTTAEVCSKAKNKYGLCDMSGNVFEWCWDFYDAGFYRYLVKYGEDTDPIGKEPETYRAIRGGSWDYSAKSARVSARSDDWPSATYYYLGFRLVRNQ